jgi:hypothetical protein
VVLVNIGQHRKMATQPPEGEKLLEPPFAQSLARHSTITLTRDRYSHISLYNEKTAIESLQTLVANKTQSQVGLKTGTDGQFLLAEKTGTKTDTKNSTNGLLW